MAPGPPRRAGFPLLRGKGDFRLPLLCVALRARLSGAVGARHMQASTAIILWRHPGTLTHKSRRKRLPAAFSMHIGVPVGASKTQARRQLCAVIIEIVIASANNRLTAGGGWIGEWSRRRRRSLGHGDIVVVRI